MGVGAGCKRVGVYLVHICMTITGFLLLGLGVEYCDMCKGKARPLGAVFDTYGSGGFGRSRLCILGFWLYVCM